MGGKQSKDKIRAAAAEARLKGEEEGRKIMQNCINAMQEELRNNKALMNQDRSWMKSTMDSFLASQTEMKEQHKDMLREMVQREATFAQERQSAETRHLQQMNVMREERERMREGQDRTMAALRDEARQERERIQREQQSTLQAVREDMKEDKERSEQEKARLMETMREEKDQILKRHDDQIHHMKDEMKEERSTMQKNLTERVESMNKEKESMAKQHESHVQTLQTAMHEEKEILQKNLEDRVGAMTEERQRIEHNYTGQITTLREDTEKMKKEKDEQMHTIKKEMTEEKQTMRQDYETRLQTEKEENKEEKNRMREEHAQQVSEIKQENKEDKEKLALTFDRHLQNVRADRDQERQYMARYHENLMAMMERRDQQFSGMIQYQQNTMTYLLGSQIPSMIQYQQATMDLLLRGQIPPPPDAYGNANFLQTGGSHFSGQKPSPMTLAGGNYAAIGYQPGIHQQMAAASYQPQTQMMTGSSHSGRILRGQPLYPQHLQAGPGLGEEARIHGMPHMQNPNCMPSAVPPPSIQNANTAQTWAEEERRKEDTASSKAAASYQRQAASLHSSSANPQPTGTGQSLYASGGMEARQMGQNYAQASQQPGMSQTLPQEFSQAYSSSPGGGHIVGASAYAPQFTRHNGYEAYPQQPDSGPCPPVRAFPYPGAGPSPRFTDTGDDVVVRHIYGDGGNSRTAPPPDNPGVQRQESVSDSRFHPAESGFPPVSAEATNDAFLRSGAGRMTPAGYQESSLPSQFSDTGYEERDFRRQTSSNPGRSPYSSLDLHNPMAPQSSTRTFGVHDRGSPFLGDVRAGIAPLRGPGDDYHPHGIGPLGDRNGGLQINLDAQGSPQPSTQLPNGQNSGSESHGRNLPSAGLSQDQPLEPVPRHNVSTERATTDTVPGARSADSETDPADDESDSMSFERLSLPSAVE